MAIRRRFVLALVRGICLGKAVAQVTGTEIYEQLCVQASNRTLTAVWRTVYPTKTSSTPPFRQ